MPPGDSNKLNRVEELKRKLFSNSFEPEMKHQSTFHSRSGMEAPEEWEEKKDESKLMNMQRQFFQKTSRFKKFFIFSLVFFGITIAYAGYVFFFAGNTVSNDNIDISVIGNTFTGGGEELSLVIGITNRNNADLELVDLVVEYPRGDSNGGAGDLEHYRESLGKIPAGSVRNENVKLTLYGEQGSVKAIKVYIEYRVAGSNAIFIKEKPFEVTISSTALNLLVDAPTTVSPNQNITLDVKSMLNAGKPLSNVMLRVDYPVGFQFVSAEPAPSFGTNIWNLGNVSPGADHDIVINGKMLDVFDGEEKSFRIYSGSQSNTDKTAIGLIYNTLTHTVMVKKPFIEANIFIGGVYQKEYAANSRDPIQGTINWGNNLESKVDDLEIRAKISGNAFNTKNVTADQGLYNSLSQEIVWNKFTNAVLAEVNPGDFGSMDFTITPVSLYSPSGGLINDPKINIDVSISGKQFTQGYEPNELNNSDSKTIKITSNMGINAKALYNGSAFTNTGPVPVKAEQETTFTIVWSLANTSNNISKGEVRAILPTWVRYMGNYAPTTENLVYNSSTREVVWNIGRIPKGAGIAAAGREVSFQVGITPLYSQIGNIPVLVNDSVLTGHDDFANVDLRATKAALTTQLTGDPNFPTSGGTVVQ